MSQCSSEYSRQKGQPDSLKAKETASKPQTEGVYKCDGWQYIYIYMYIYIYICIHPSILCRPFASLSFHPWMSPRRAVRTTP